MKTAILATCYIDSEYKAKLLEMWLHLNMTLNPECAGIIVDSTPEHAKKPWYGMWQKTLWGYHHKVEPGKLTLLSFGESIGHPYRDKVDGAARSFFHGLKQIIENGFDRFVYNEADLLMNQPVRDQFNFAEGKQISIPYDRQYSFYECGLKFANVAYLKEIDYCRTYHRMITGHDDLNDWRMLPDVPFGEEINRQIFGDKLQTSNLVGYRQDSFEGIANQYPDPDYITHAPLEAMQAFYEKTLAKHNFNIEDDNA